MDLLAISTHGLTKRYGNLVAVRDLTLEVNRGEIFGFLGPNGAGKTTTIRLLMDMVRPSAGRAEIFGTPPRDPRIRSRIGYVGGDNGLYDDLTAAELLRFGARLRGGVDEAYARSLAERLRCDLDLRIGSMSHGTRQKVALLLAMQHRPDLLIMDEPTQGLDPLVQRTFLDMLREARSEGRTVFISSHVLAEVQELCDRVGMIRQGSLIAVDRVDALRDRVAHSLEVRFAEQVPPAAFRGLDGVRDVVVEGAVARCKITGTPDAFLKVAARYTIVDIVSNEPSLEEVFLSFYGDGEEDRDASSIDLREVSA